MQSKPILSVFLLGSCVLQAQQLQRGSAQSTGVCSLANSGTVRTVQIKCGIDLQQGKRMLEILNTILTNQEKLPADLVLQKLDEILKSVNPNAANKTYTCAGGFQVVGPSPNAVFNVQLGGVDTEKAKIMFDHFAQRDYRNLITSCEEFERTDPNWLTPLLFCAVGYGATGRLDQAKTTIKEYEDRVGPAYTQDPMCAELYSKVKAASLQ